MENATSSLTETRSWRTPTALTCVALIALAACVITIVSVRRAADREYDSYKTLCSLGATGDDWVSFLEFVTGRPPIVQIQIPADIPKEITFALLPDLHNLEALTIEYDSLSDDQLDTIRNMGIDSLRFSGDFPTDDDVDRLSRLNGTRYVYIPSANLSVTARHQAQGTLSSSKVTFD